MSFGKDYEIVIKTDVKPELRSKNPNTEINYSPVNGGLYGGEQKDRPWMPQHIVPTATNLMLNNLKSANPPPGAIEQYIGTNRQGNNYSAMPNIYWYYTEDEGPHHIKVTH